MEYWVENCTGYLLESWRNATLVNYVQLMLAIILVGWYLRRFSSE